MNQTNQTDTSSSRRQQGKKVNSGNFLHYSGPMVNIAYVDQWSGYDKNQHLPQNEKTDHWEPLGLDHQSGYSYLYQHSGYECAERDEEKQTNNQKMNERQILD